MNTHIRSSLKSIALALAVLVVGGGMTGCDSDGQSGALIGAGIGALAGQAIGGDTGGTLVGAAVGSGVGYVIGNEQDKKHANDMSRRSEPRGYTHDEVGPLGGTRWQVVSLAPADYGPEFTSRIIEFRPYGRVITTTTEPDGNVMVDDERYRVVGRTLIINRPGMIVNAEFAIERDEMIIDADEFRAVLRRLRP